MEPRDCYLRRTDKTGNVFVTSHRTWDVERFVQSQQDAANKVGGESAVVRISEAEYKKEK